jgi:hypothetical protein
MFELFQFTLYLKRSRLKNLYRFKNGASFKGLLKDDQSIMHVFFTLITIALFSISIVLSNWLASVACSLLLVLLFVTRFLASRIVKRSFKNLTPIESTEFARHAKAFKTLYSDEFPEPKIYVADQLNPVQMYAFGDFKKINIVLSPTMLKHVSDEDLIKMFKQSYSLSKNPKFLSKKHFVALFLLLSSVGRYLDATLSFFLGIKTKNGEPKALTRKLIYLIANLFKSKPRYKSQNDYSLKNYSYLSFYHDHPILGPLSIADMNM